MIPNDDLARITCSLQKIREVFDRVSKALDDLEPDLRAFVFATTSAEAAMRAQESYREQKQQAPAVSPRPNFSPRAGVAQPESKNENDSDSEDAPNQKTGADYVENTRNRPVFHKNAKDVSFKGDGSWCE